MREANQHVVNLIVMKDAFSRSLPESRIGIPADHDTSPDKCPHVSTDSNPCATGVIALG
jgi:hypothetical protein